MPYTPAFGWILPMNTNALDAGTLCTPNLNCLWVGIKNLCIPFSKNKIPVGLYTTIYADN